MVGNVLYAWGAFSLHVCVTITCTYIYIYIRDKYCRQFDLIYIYIYIYYIHYFSPVSQRLLRWGRGWLAGLYILVVN